ncbi:hypothetical protein P3X46_002065 [Hevea brasiliensis]|uniref:Plastid division protein CDP1-like 2nd alpha solenoid domain-containing protein n=1 Tax=Hevea brasiliensis TaxID=3981 RepID=A0ABQ9N4B6_HEVBR|nr:hypothetical protein P3X46_002065 [Hevea brasiliensis]
MEGIRWIGVGICTSTLVTTPLIPNPLPRKSSKLIHTSLATTYSASKWADRLFSDFQILNATADTSSDLRHSLSSSSATLAPSSPAHLAPPERHVPIPLHFYQRAYEARVSKPPQYGFSQDALISILQAACETLADPKSRREYNQGLIDDGQDTIITQVPWDKVIELLRERLPKSFKQDVLAMALAYVDLKKGPAAWYEIYEHKLMTHWRRSPLDFALELLALPLRDEYWMRLAEGLNGVCNILWAFGGGGAAPVAGGFTREDFMVEAFLHVTAAEQVDLFVATPNNIPAERFEVYGVALALVAQAVTGKKPHLIPDADGQFQRLQQMKVSSQGSVVSIYSPEQNHEIDFALERGLCLLLVGELDECHKWLGLDSDDSDDSSYRNPPIVDIVMEKSQGDDDNDVRGLCKLLEAWLTEVVFTRFRDIKDMQFKLRDYYDDPAILRYLGRREGGGHSSMAAAAAIVRIGAEATAVIDHAKASAIQALQKVFPPSQEVRILESRKKVD